ncbi:helix-turn-helix domain-containing protein [Brevibacillus reuszeri]|uniref:helix-turn-helix domain-containing protein n=1 Tax=Brevibacillus reuszeri TaxID=54915 RepID=UPI000CCC4A55|nr:helix-turn-helix transcriptional regulator [Brevibacillus reuszeri]
MKRAANLGEKIKSIRIEKGITARFVAKKVGISPSTLCKYEKNSRAIRAELLPAFADALGVDLKVFFEEIVGKTPIKQPA